MIYLLPADLAVKVEDALTEAQAREQDSMLERPTAKGLGWEYDIAFADSGFHCDIKAGIELPMRTLNTELQVR